MEFLPFVSEDCMCIALEFTLHILEAEANKSLMTVFVGVGFTSLITIHSGLKCSLFPKSPFSVDTYLGAVGGGIGAQHRGQERPSFLLWNVTASYKSTATDCFFLGLNLWPGRAHIKIQ